MAHYMDAILVNDPSACSAVLGLEELLAHILDYLPLNELFRAQIVCQRWHATLQSSALQRSFFLESEPDPSGSFVYDAAEGTIAKHPCSERPPTRRNPLKQVCILNEAIFNAPEVHQVWENPEGMEYDSVEASVLHFRDGLSIYALSKPPLKDMFLTQPPVRKAQVLWDYGGGSRVGDITNENGLRGMDLFKNVPSSTYPMSRWSAVDMIDLANCHLRLDRTWTSEPKWLAVTVREREALEVLAEGHQMPLARGKLLWTP